MPPRRWSRWRPSPLPGRDYRRNASVAAASRRSASAPGSRHSGWRQQCGEPTAPGRWGSHFPCSGRAALRGPYTGPPIREGPARAAGACVGPPVHVGPGPRMPLDRAGLRIPDLAPPVGRMAGAGAGSLPVIVLVAPARRRPPKRIDGGGHQCDVAIRQRHTARDRRGRVSGLRGALRHTAADDLQAALDGDRGHVSAPEDVGLGIDGQDLTTKFEGQPAGGPFRVPDGPDTGRDYSGESRARGPGAPDMGTADLRQVRIGPPWAAARSTTPAHPMPA